MYVAGSNLFGQWFSEEPVFTKFHIVREKPNNFEKSKLIQINWAYNIYQNNNTFFLSGSWKGKDYQQLEIPIPNECKTSCSSYSLMGNDYNLFFIDKNISYMWIVNNQTDTVKKISIKTESVTEDVSKKICKHVYLEKALCTNLSSMFLSSEGNVYCGFLPSLVDTRHCRGAVTNVQLGYEHFIILTDAGVVYTWGNGRRLQLGHGDISNSDTPTELEALSGIKIVKIAAGGWHSLALSEFGDVYAWGWNDTGQLGIRAEKEELKSSSTPVLVDLYNENGVVEKNVKDVACGSRNSAILLEDNTVWTTGCNKYGQLGFSNKEYESVTSFKQSFSCEENIKLKCGPWSTVLVTETI